MIAADGRAPFLVGFADPTVPAGTRVVAFWNTIILLSLMEKKKIIMVVNQVWKVVTVEED
jgi:hypothetical protein